MKRIGAREEGREEEGLCGGKKSREFDKEERRERRGEGNGEGERR